jgi:TrmH family RNA methyltransferase
VATVPRGGQPYDRVDLRGPVAIVLGSEAHGLPVQVTESVDELVTIPMAGRSESLNVAMAGSVLCFESLRQRRGASP